MQIRHETDIPYVVVDKRLNSLEIKLEVLGNHADDLLCDAHILYGDSYDYQDERNYCWNHHETKMNLRYAAGNMQVWDVIVPIPQWKRVKYTFLLTMKNGEEYLYNEYGLQVKDLTAMDRLLNTYHSHFFIPMYLMKM